MKVLAFLVMVTVSLSGGGQAVAQTTPSVAYVFTHADTLRALHTLFRAGRSRGQVITALAPVPQGPGP